MYHEDHMSMLFMKLVTQLAFFDHISFQACHR